MSVQSNIGKIISIRQKENSPYHIVVFYEPSSSYHREKALSLKEVAKYLSRYYPNYPLKQIAFFPDIEDLYTEEDKEYFQSVTQDQIRILLGQIEKRRVLKQRIGLVSLITWLILLILYKPILVIIPVILLIGFIAYTLMS